MIEGPDQGQNIGSCSHRRQIGRHAGLRSAFGSVHNEKTKHGEFIKRIQAETKYLKHFNEKELYQNERNHLDE